MIPKKTYTLNLTNPYIMYGTAKEAIYIGQKVI